jgi:hypothetical protein
MLLRLVIKTFVISVVAVLLLWLAVYVGINLYKQWWVYDIQKDAVIRLNIFLREYQHNKQVVSSNYRIRNKPDSGYKDYKTKLNFAIYAGDPDVNVQVEHEVTLIYKEGTKVYKVLQVFTHVDESLSSRKKDLKNDRNWLMQWKLIFPDD